VQRPADHRGLLDGHRAVVGEPGIRDERDPDQVGAEAFEAGSFPGGGDPSGVCRPPPGCTWMLVISGWFSMRTWTALPEVPVFRLCSTVAGGAFLPVPDRPSCASPATVS
jgi:hypothetical protein